MVVVGNGHIWSLDHIDHSHYVFNGMYTVDAYSTLHSICNDSIALGFFCSHGYLWAHKKYLYLVVCELMHIYCHEVD